MFVGGALAAVLGALIGYLGFRFGLRGFYFVLLTVAFAEVCRIVALNIDAVGGRAGALHHVHGQPAPVPVPGHRAPTTTWRSALMLGWPPAIAAVIERRRFGVYLSGDPRGRERPARRWA